MSKLNSLGYAVLSDKMSQRVFGNGVVAAPPSKSKVSEVVEEMEKFGVKFPITNPESFFLEDFNLPPLQGKNIKDHFDNISTSLYKGKVARMKDFAYEEIPSPPDKTKYFLYAGWVRYPFDGSPEVVNGIEEDICVYDCETFVKGSDFAHPILATAVTAKAYYIWMHPSFVNPSLPYEPMLVPLGRKDGIFIAHNVAYDRPRTQEAYVLGKTNSWFDTMSAHINVSGLASGQRWWYVQKQSKKSTFRADPVWSQNGSLNNLIDCYNFHCKPAIPLEQEDKETREMFVKAENMVDFAPHYDELISYALNDVKITFELYSILVLKYLQNNPSLTTLAGHFGIASAKLPVVNDWAEWFNNCEKAWYSSIAQQERTLSQFAKELYEAWNEGELVDEDVKADPWLSQLDWEANFKLTKAGKPSSKWYGVPKWVRTVSSKDLVDGKPVIEGISTKNRLSHILLRLKWDDQPIHFFTDKGWCYMDEDSGSYMRIPHKDGEGVNVGNVLTKDYVEDFESGILTSDLPEARELIGLAINVAYWTSVRSRVREQNIETVTTSQGAEFNLIVPASVPHNTSTNRAGENLWLTVPDPKYDKIGSEIKTRVQAPEGYVFVESDFDAQEAVVASIFADSYHKIAGSTQFSHSILAGSKDDGSDMHSMTAKAIGISRAVAKGCNYGMLYGCGAKTLANTIRKGNKAIPMREAMEMGKKLIKIKKGQKASRTSQTLIGGSDSYAYNEMARVANMPCPINPLSGTKMSTAFRPSTVGTDFWTMRNNWCIQSTGSAMLHAFMTAMEWLIDKYELEAEFCMSVHDSILYLCPEAQAEKVAALFQVAHAWCWAWLRYNYEIYELPVANAWLSSIEIDKIFRKSATSSTKTVSQQKAEGDGYSVTIQDLTPVLNSMFNKEVSQ
jgi:DNA polymerase gamma 1